MAGGIVGKPHVVGACFYNELQLQDMTSGNGIVNITNGNLPLNPACYPLLLPVKIQSATSNLGIVTITEIPQVGSDDVLLSLVKVLGGRSQDYCDTTTCIQILGDG